VTGERLSPLEDGPDLLPGNLGMEDALVADSTFVEAHRQAFRGLYVRLSRPA
jgi:hypothetical protein